MHYSDCVARAGGGQHYVKERSNLQAQCSPAEQRSVRNMKQNGLAIHSLKAQKQQMLWIETCFIHYQRAVQIEALRAESMKAGL